MGTARREAGVPIAESRPGRAHKRIRGCGAERARCVGREHPTGESMVCPMRIVLVVVSACVALFIAWTSVGSTSSQKVGERGALVWDFLTGMYLWRIVSSNYGSVKRT